MASSVVSMASRRAWPVAVPLLAGAFGALAGWLASRAGTPTDFEVFWSATRALVAGADPYAVIAARGGYPLFYPLPALLALLPVAWLPVRLAMALSMGLGAGLFAVAAQRYGRGLGVGLLGGAALDTLAGGRWGLLLTAGAVLPWLAPLWVAKPNIGLALFAGFPVRRALWGGGGLVLLSLLLRPTWPVAWLEALRSTNHVAPILRPGGVLLLLAWLRWRTPEGRLLGALALIPQTTALYELVPLWLLPRTQREGLLLSVLSLVCLLGQVLLDPGHPGETVEASLVIRWPLVLGLVYLPALALVLRPQSTGSSPRT